MTKEQTKKNKLTDEEKYNIIKTILNIAIITAFITFLIILLKKIIIMIICL